MKKSLLWLVLALSPLAAARAVAPVRAGVVVLDATQFLGELPDGDTANNGRQGGGGGGRRGAAPAGPARPVPTFTFENFSINLRAAAPFSAKANIPNRGTWYLYVRSRSATDGSSFKVSVGNKPSPGTFGDTPADTFESAGSFELP
ncbi:MAG TPA: hypothetical protein VHM90_09250, partial [Phycisphaerae bacterium]|nr:hypothetical protein [Phycisphaerae bacterium]